jgi:hypothetical protein
LNQFGQELCASICLHALYRERHFLDYPFQKLDRVLRGTPWKYSEDPPSRAIVNRCVLIDAAANLHGVELKSIARYWAAVALWVFRPPRAL